MKTNGKTYFEPPPPPWLRGMLNRMLRAGIESLAAYEPGPALGSDQVAPNVREHSDKAKRHPSGECGSMMGGIITLCCRIERELRELSASGTAADYQETRRADWVEVLSILEAGGVKRFEPSVGDPYDAVRHIARRSVDSANALEIGRVNRVFTSGFTRASDGTVVRPALVSVWRDASKALTVASEREGGTNGQ